MTVAIPISGGFFALVDDEDYERVSSYGRWSILKNGGHLYAAHAVRATGKRKQIALQMHRVVMNYSGPLDVDHKNRDGLDNRKENLRLATRSQNRANSKPCGASSHFKGVYFDKPSNKYRARACKNGVFYALGYYINEEDAAKAYDRGAVYLFGEFARLNFPIEG